MSVLLLFDIDGTLVRVPAARRAYEAVFRQRYGKADVLSGFDFSGQTDRIAFRLLAQQAGERDPDVRAIIESYLEHLEREIQNDPGYCLPGARAFVEACAQEPDFFLALGTGNVERGARVKLGAHQLNDYFPTGGFADDGEERAEILAAAIRKSERFYGRSFQRFVVIGDTPRDIAAARAVGARVLAVATGRPSPEQLRQAGPDALLDDLRDLKGSLATLRALVG